MNIKFEQAKKELEAYKRYIQAKDLSDKEEVSLLGAFKAGVEVYKAACETVNTNLEKAVNLLEELLSDIDGYPDDHASWIEDFLESING